MAPSVFRFFAAVGCKTKPTEKKRVRFSVSVFGGTGKPTKKKVVFGREEPTKTDRKKTLSVFGSQPCLSHTAAASSRDFTRQSNHLHPLPPSPPVA